MRPYMRGDVMVRPFSKEEDELINDLRILGAGTTEIAGLLLLSTGSKRSPATINMRLKTLAARDEREDA